MTDDRTETITDPAEIRATDEPDERGDFPCCTTPAPVGAAVALDLRSHESLLVAAYALRGASSLADDDDTAQWLEVLAQQFEDDAANTRPTPAPSSGAGLDLDALHETICDNFTGMAEVRQAADLLVAEVRRLTRWQSEALLVMVGLQGLGSALGMRLGESTTGHAAAEAARALTARAEAAEAEVRRLTEDLDAAGGRFATNAMAQAKAAGVLVDHPGAGVSGGTVLQGDAEITRLRSVLVEEIARAEAAEAEVGTLRAKVAAVEAVVCDWPCSDDTCDGDCTGCSYASDLRAALATTGEGEHVAREVFTADGIPFVRCSCTNAKSPTSSRWLAEHVPNGGVAELQAVVKRQAEGAKA